MNPTPDYEKAGVYIIPLHTEQQQSLFCFKYELSKI